MNQKELLDFVRDRILTGIAFANMAENYGDPEMQSDLEDCRGTAIAHLNEALDEVCKVIDADNAFRNN